MADYWMGAEPVAMDADETFMDGEPVILYAGGAPAAGNVIMNAQLIQKILML